MPADSLPTTPTFEELTGWAGAGRVIRATPDQVAGWRLPPAQLAALTGSGVPLIEDGIVTSVVFRADPPFYRLTDDADDEGAVFLAEPETGRIFERYWPGDVVRFVNSSVNHWLCSLHLVGSALATSSAIRDWDQDPEAEEVALAELAELRDRIRRLDPGITGDRHDEWYWPGVLDRWLY